MPPIFSEAMSNKGSVLKALRAALSLASFLGVHASSKGKLSTDGNRLVDENGNEVSAYVQKSMHDKAKQIYDYTVDVIMDPTKRTASIWHHFPLRGLSIGSAPSDIKKTVCACMCACV